MSVALLLVATHIVPMNPSGSDVTRWQLALLEEFKLVINRPTTAADQAKIDKDLVYKWTPTPWPVDKSGNGGGGKSGV